MSDHSSHFDPYLAYCDIITRTYGAAYCPTREQWAEACRQPPAPRQSDIQFDYDKECLGDAQ